MNRNKTTTILILCVLFAFGGGSIMAQDVSITLQAVWDNDLGLFPREVYDFLDLMYPGVDIHEVESLYDAEDYCIVDFEAVTGPFLTMSPNGLGSIDGAFAVMAVVTEAYDEYAVWRPDIAVISMSSDGLDIVARYAPGELYWEQDYRNEGNSGYTISTEALSDDGVAIKIVQRMEGVGDIGGRTIEQVYFYTISGDSLYPVLCLTTEFGEGGYNDPQMHEYEWDARYATYTVSQTVSDGMKSIDVQAYDSHIEKKNSAKNDRMELVADDISNQRRATFTWHDMEYESSADIGVRFDPDSYNDPIMFFSSDGER